MTKILKECNKAITKEIAKEFRNEAREIIKLTTDKHRQDFLCYYKKNQGNVCCLVLDTAKRDLIAEGLMTLKNGDGFGKPLIL